jgi:hypothetical protein
MSTMNDFFEIPALPLPFFYYCHSQTKYHRPGSMKKAPSPRLNEKKHHCSAKQIVLLQINHALPQNPAPKSPPLTTKSPPLP